MSELTQDDSEIEMNENMLDDSLMSTAVNKVEDMSIENSNEPTELNLDKDNHYESCQILETSKNLDSNNEPTINNTLMSIPPQVCVFNFTCVKF